MTNHTPAPPDPTQRLSFHELTAEDLDFVAAMLGHPEVMRYYPGLYSRDEAMAWIERQRGRYARDGHGLWLLRERASGVPVGQVGLVTQTVDGTPEIEVGYLVHRPFWRRGYASEAARAARDHAFGRLGRARVVSLIRPENLPSQGVAAKLGMTVEKRAAHGGFDHCVFAVRRPE